VKSSIRFRTVKVSDKGQIAIPADIQREIGIKRGDELVLIQRKGKIVLEKAERVVDKFEDEFKDLESISESSLKRLWLNKEDEIWNSYLKET
jgi:AbrB family looped-hinge helix DNA binding protein